MATKYQITSAQKEEIELARKANRDKRTEAKLKVLFMRAEGEDSKKISEVTGFHSAYVSTIVSKYIHGGIEAITCKHYGGNRRNMTYEEEATFLAQFIDEADGGHITDVKAIKAAYDKKVGHRNQRLFGTVRVPHCLDLIWGKQLFGFKVGDYPFGQAVFDFLVWL